MLAYGKRTVACKVYAGKLGKSLQAMRWIKLDSQRLFSILTAFFIASLVVADTIGAKLVYIGGQTIVGITLPKYAISAGLIAFPLTFVLTDIVNEFFGEKAARFLTIVGLATAIYVYGIFSVSNQLPTTEFTLISQNTFSQFVGAAQGVFVASLTAYLIGQFVDIQVFFMLRKLTKERFLWLRATGSTVVSQLVDSFVVTAIVGWGKMTALQIFTIGINNYSIKFLIALGLTPICYLGHSIIHALLHPSTDPELDISEFEFKKMA